MQIAGREKEKCCESKETLIKLTNNKNVNVSFSAISDAASAIQLRKFDDVNSGY